MPKEDDEELSVLLKGAIDDVKELAQAEIALAKSELTSLGTSLFVALATFTAACVLVALALAAGAAMLALVLGGSATSALAAATVVIALAAATAVTLCVRMLPSRDEARNRSQPREKTA